MVVRVVADLASRRPERIEVVDMGVGIPPDRQGADLRGFRAGKWQYRAAVWRYRARSCRVEVVMRPARVPAPGGEWAESRVAVRRHSDSDCAGRSDRKAGVSFATLRPSL